MVNGEQKDTGMKMSKNGRIMIFSIHMNQFMAKVA